MNSSPSQIYTPDLDDAEAVAEQEEGPEALFASMADPEIAESPLQQGMGQDPGTLYLGESFNLTFVVKTVCSPAKSSMELEPTKVHYPVPMSSRDPSANGANALSFLDDDVLAFLQARGALTMPSKEVGDALVSIFFQSIHPAFPVFDRREFDHLYRQGAMSLLALQTIYFIAATICDKKLLDKTVCRSRY